VGRRVESSEAVSFVAADRTEVAAEGQRMSQPQVEVAVAADAVGMIQFRVV